MTKILEAQSDGFRHKGFTDWELSLLGNNARLPSSVIKFNEILTNVYS